MIGQEAYADKVFYCISDILVEIKKLKGYEKKKRDKLIDIIITDYSVSAGLKPEIIKCIIYSKWRQ
jgi:hypothetical protein